jgi:hypothetical protein
MTDDLLRPLPAGPRPPADGFALALRDARRRRWKTLRTNAAALTAAAAAVVAAVMPRLATSSVAGLEPARPGVTAAASPRTTAAGTPKPTAPPSTPPSSFRPLRGGGVGVPPPSAYAPDPAGPSAPVAVPAPPATAGAEPRAPRTGPRPTQPVPTGVPQTPAPSPAPPPEPEPVDLTYEDQPVNGTCETSAWCVTASVTGPADGTRVLRLRACRPASDTAGTLRFTTENEADFRVLHDGVEVWRWSHGQPDDAYAHDVYVDRWQCAVWSTPWSRTDQNGGAVAPGSYVLEAWSASTSLPDRWWGTAFTVG